jgi:hypothetical protein
MSLAFAKAHSASFTRALGVARLDLASGLLSVELTGAEDEGQLDLWLVDAGDPENNIEVRLGAIPTAKNRRLEVRLDPEELSDLRLDRLVVARAELGPREGALVQGGPSLFQRLYYAEMAGDGMIDLAGASPERPAPPFAALIPAPAFAQAAPDLAALVTEGEDLFNNETFGGNGRTCATFHPADNNFTIDPDYIATLGKRDPLFIAETDRALRDLGNPTLMREYGLILANVDGLDDPANKFVMRSVPHIFGMSRSIQSNAAEAPFASRRITASSLRRKCKRLGQRKIT